MRGAGQWAMIGAVILFAVFLANVLTRTVGTKTFLSDVGEMLFLFIACIAFVVAILQREGAEKQ